MSPWIEVFGRLHPLILHAPIGLLVGLAGLEAWAVVRRGAVPAEWTRVLAWLAAGSAVLAAGTGYVLSREDGYGSEAVTRHLQLGLALAGASVVTAVLRSRGGETAARDTFKAELARLLRWTRAQTGPAMNLAVHGRSSFHRAHSASF